MHWSDSISSSIVPIPVAGRRVTPSPKTTEYVVEDGKGKNLVNNFSSPVMCIVAPVSSMARLMVGLVGVGLVVTVQASK